MQEVFVRVATKHDSYRGDAPMLRWIYRITTNLCLNRLRQKRTHPVVADPQAVLRMIDGTTRSEDRGAVMTVLAAHDELTQQIAVYYFVDEMSMEEVAETVGYSRKTVSKKLERFRKRARAMLSDREVREVHS
nr:ECF RNA polymerase sigma factor SigM-like [Nerophis lumbriciformis]